MLTEFKVGDVVGLRSVGPYMTIRCFLSEDEQEKFGGDCCCNYFEGTLLKTEIMNTDKLEHIY
jgi:uncharacterized protein YodC (DUF2158 family)